MVDLVRNPNAEAQLKENMNRARLYLEELKAEVLIDKKNPIFSILDQTEKQLRRELDLLDEA